MEEAHERRADELDQEADDLEKGGDALEDQIKDTREDWESKKSSQQAPGAMDRGDAAPGGLGEEEEEDDEDEDQAEGDAEDEDEDEDEDDGEESDNPDAPGDSG